MLLFLVHSEDAVLRAVDGCADFHEPSKPEARVLAVLLEHPSKQVGDTQTPLTDVELDMKPLSFSFCSRVGGGACT